MYYAESNGSKIIALYDDANGNVPAAAVAISDELFAEIHAHKLTMNAYNIVNGSVVLNPDAIITFDRQVKIAQAKELANIKIDKMVPERKREHMLVESLMIINNRAQRPLSLSEQATLDSNESILLQIKSIRDASDAIEADILISADPENYDVSSSDLWPV